MSSSSSLPSDTTDPLAAAAATTTTTTLPPRAPTTAAASSLLNHTSSTSLGGDSSSSSIPVPRRLGSISGLRTVSGSISGLQGTGSFDDIALSTANDNHNNSHHHPNYWSTSHLEEDTGVRRRANTENNNNHHHHYASTSLLPGFLTSTTTAKMSAPPPPPVTASPSEDSTNSHNYAFQHSTSSNDSADEEMKMAKAMALAVQSNPNLTPDELRQLMATTQQQQQQKMAQQQQQAKAAAAAASAPPKSATSMLIPGRLSNVFHLSTNDIESSVHNSGPTSTSSSHGSSSTNHNNNSNSNMAPLQKLKNFQETFRASGQKARERFMDIVGTKSNEEPALTSSTHTTTPTNHAPNPTANTNNNNSSGGGKVPPAPPATRPLSPIVTSGDTPSSGKRSPFRATGVMKTIGRSLPMPSIATVPSDVDSVANSVITDTVSDAPNSKSPAAVSNYQVGAEGPIRLTTIVWKRRSGLGKYSVHSAWERRRITLQGTRLSYYTTAGGNNDSIHASEPQNSFSRDMDDSGGVDSLPKKTNWFEQATASLVAGSSNLLGGEDHTTPRGYVDLIKDGASVAAATGHSGAPTPFAISIKVRGETKWKLCFDMHKTQMEWLAALTDVVVQGSVDAYNASLVDAMNPAHIDMFQAPPVVFEPPATKGAAATSTAPGGGHRLWMLGTYTIKSQNQLDLDDDDDGQDINGEDNDDTLVDETTTRDDDDDEDDDDVKVKSEKEVATTEEKDKATAIEDESPVDTTTEVASREAISEDDETEESDDPVPDASTWSIPEKNLIYVATVLNISLALARASSTSIEGFWYLWVFANFALYQCTYHHVQKGKRVLGRAKMSQVAAESVTITTTDTMRSSGGTQEEVVTTKTDVKRVSVTTFKSKSVKALRKEETTAAPSGFKPVAGTTSVQIQNPTDVPMNSLNHIFAGWRAPPGEILQVRSHGYMTTKKKVPSPGELYKLAALDVFESPRRYPDMAPRVQLPKVEFDDGDKPKTWHSPDIFIISLAIPTDPPKMTGTTESDGGGYTVTVYLTMHQDTRDILRRITAEDYDPSQEPPVDDVQKSKVNAVRLFEEWCRRAPTDPKFQSRFKLVPNAHNLKEIGMPGWISKYNGKPLLIKRPGQTGFLIPHPELSCIEFDISLHVFPFVAKKAICYVKEHFFRKVLVSFGFVIEGRADDELPECVIGLMQLCYPDPIHAIQAKDFFAGKCPRSFD